MTNEIKTIFDRLETFKNGYLNHYYTQIAGGGYVLLDDIATLKSYITAIETPEPLTDEERKELEDNDIAFEPLKHAERLDNRDIVFTELVYKKSTLDDMTPFIYGIGRTKAEAERDAYNQLKEAKLI